ncbi:hypothetical protein VTK73DRAFT_9688 [Phialemonium thermophilum]|uniref:Uncharacterized protein n=1 Tax=Phialemonium thermophilum TaxID=223376 RepID=A0ABR3W0X5_9PEZI
MAGSRQALRNGPSWHNMPCVYGSEPRVGSLWLVLPRLRRARTRPSKRRRVLRRHYSHNPATRLLKATYLERMEVPAHLPGRHQNAFCSRGSSACCLATRLPAVSCCSTGCCLQSGSSGILSKARAQKLSSTTDAGCRNPSARRCYPIITSTAIAAHAH